MDTPVLPSIPQPSVLWRPLRSWGWAVYATLFLAAVPDVIVDYWFFQSLGRASIFWTNFNAQLGLFLAAALAFTLAVYVPIRSSPFPRAGLHVGLWTGIFAGWLLSRHYLDYLLAFHGATFGARDPIFGRDIGWYVFRLPAVATTLQYLVGLALVGAGASIVGRFLQGAVKSAKQLVTPALNAFLFLLGISLTLQTFLSRYGLLFRDNGDSGVRAGAEFLDVNGILSTLHVIHVSVLVELGLLAVIGYSLYRVQKRRPLLPSLLKLGVGFRYDSFIGT